MPRYTHKDLEKDLRNAPVPGKKYTHADLARDLRLAPPPRLPKTSAPAKMMPAELSYGGKKAVLVPMAKGFMVVGNGAEAIYQRMLKALEAPKTSEFRPKIVPKKKR